MMCCIIMAISNVSLLVELGLLLVDLFSEFPVVAHAAALGAERFFPSLCCAFCCFVRLLSFC
jgi:hypothetical protein